MAEPQATAHGEGLHLVLFDGVCGVCRRSIQFILQRDRARVFDFASLQSDTGRAIVQRFGSNPDELTSMYVVAHYRTAGAVAYTRARAALFVARSLGWPWKAAGLLSVLPIPLLNAAYDFVARNRYRIFGRHEHCVLPRSEDRNRFIDV